MREQFRLNPGGTIETADIVRTHICSGQFPDSPRLEAENFSNRLTLFRKESDIALNAGFGTSCQGRMSQKDFMLSAAIDDLARTRRNKNSLFRSTVSSTDQCLESTIKQCRMKKILCDALCLGQFKACIGNTLASLQLFDRLESGAV